MPHQSGAESGRSTLFTRISRLHEVQGVTATQRPGSTSRRAFLILGVAGGLGLAGCTSQSPAPGRSESSPSAQPPTPAPLPGTVAAAAREASLAAYAAAALQHFGTHLTTAETHLLSGLAEAHRTHVAVLGQVDPTVIKSAAPTSPSPTSPSPTSPSPTSPSPSGPGASSSATPPALGHGPKATLTKLRRLESDAAKSYASLVAAPGGGTDQQAGLVLLWGSLATAAAGYATLCASGADPGPQVVGSQRADVELPDRNTAIGNLVSQCYAIIFGYQSAIAYLSDSAAGAARDRLADYRELRDRLAAVLSDQHATVPAPDSAYRLPVQPKSDASATRLVGLMETRMLPYLGQWLATAEVRDRRRNLATMITSDRYVLGLSPRIEVWPGYPATP